MDSHSGRPGRRTFLKRSLAGLAGAAMLPHLSPAGAAEAPGRTADAAKRVFRPLGRTGIKLPIVSIGAASYEPSLYQAALDRGIVHIDTSQYYYNGRHEETVGRAVKGRKRDSFVVATSLLLGNGQPGSYSTFRKEDAPRMSEQFEVSLKRLGLDFVDIFYIAGTGSRAAALDEPLLAGLQKIKESGKARFVGAATHGNQAEVIRAAVESKVHDVVLTVLNFRMRIAPEIRASIAAAAKSGLGIIVMKPMAGAYWDREKKQPINGKAALKWILQDENVTTTVPGITTLEQLESDFSLMADPVLTAEEKADLKLADGAASPAGLFCQGCGGCLAQCPAGLAIPTLMRGYMYAYGYRDLGQARAAVDQAGFSELPCGECVSCRVNCAMGFDVKARALDIARLKAVPEDFLGF